MFRTVIEERVNRQISLQLPERNPHVQPVHGIHFHDTAVGTPEPGVFLAERVSVSGERISTIHVNVFHVPPSPVMENRTPVRIIEGKVFVQHVFRETLPHFLHGREPGAIQSLLARQTQILSHAGITMINKYNSRDTPRET